MMNILLTNDDGIHASGLMALYEIFSLQHKVVVIAPDREQSAVGHGITLKRPIRAKRIDLGKGNTGYAVSGTPVDCIKLGLMELLDMAPDIVVSGINRGANLGVNINYSGTAAAAREAVLYKIPSIAVSVQGQNTDNYEDAARFVYNIAHEVNEKGLPFGTFLNVNIPGVPGKNIKGTRICRQGLSFPNEYMDKRKDPRNNTYYWHGCEFDTPDTDPDIDGVAVDENYISITPVQCDMTNYLMLKELEEWASLQSHNALRN